MINAVKQALILGITYTQDFWFHPNNGYQAAGEIH
jgi:hypothetical protein